MKNKTNEKTENQNQTVIFEPAAPHSAPVDIGELLAEIETLIKRHVVLSDAAATALAVWVLHTYVYESRDTVAYVAIESPEKRCGKTTLLSVLSAMANKPLIASNITVGALFRAIDTCRPTLFIDEADTFLAGRTAMRGIINSGNTWRTAYVLRLSKLKPRRNAGGSSVSLAHRPSPDGGVGGGSGSADRSAVDSAQPLPHGRGSVDRGAVDGTDSGLERYSCWCPKVIAMIGKVPDTIADRSIVVPMARKLVTETRLPLAALDATQIKAKCVRFALDNGQKVSECEKIHGEGLNDRAADTFDPLYVIARLAGEDWEQKLHAAALALATGAQSRHSGTELLRDIYVLMTMGGKEKIFTRELINLLQNQHIASGSLALKYASLDEHKIAQLLRPYGIKPVTFRIGKCVGRGYAREDINDPLARYVPKADVDARIQELKEQIKLWDEVDEEEKAEWHTVPTGVGTTLD